MEQHITHLLKSVLYTMEQGKLIGDYQTTIYQDFFMLKESILRTINDYVMQLLINQKESSFLIVNYINKGLSELRQTILIFTILLVPSSYTF